MRNVRRHGKVSWICVSALVATAICSAGADKGKEIMQIVVEGRKLVTYQSEPMSKPRGGDMFKGSNFIHPLKTPSGFVVTDLQPDDHLHHFGLWWPWKFIEVGGRNVLFWELQNGEGIIQAQNVSPVGNGFSAKSVYIDRKAARGPLTVLAETANVAASAITDEPAKGYFLDSRAATFPDITHIKIACVE